MQRLLLWGATGQAKVLAELGASLGFQVVALIDNNPGVQSHSRAYPFFTGWMGSIVAWPRSASKGWRALRRSGVGEAAIALRFSTSWRTGV